MLLAHYRYGADAALYWDAIDYLQPGHDAITPGESCAGRRGFARRTHYSRRTRYYGMLQVLPYLQPGARVLDAHQLGGPDLGSLAVQTRTGEPALFLVNQGGAEVDLNVHLRGESAARFSALALWRTDRDHKAEPLGRVHLQDGFGQLILPPRSLTTLFPAGAAVSPDD